MTGRLRIARRVTQIAALAFFLYLFARTSVAAMGALPPDLFLLIDPLAAFSAMIAQRQFALELVLWALPLVVLTLVMGRVFCGWLCPLGTIIDGSDAAFFRHTKSPSAHEQMRKWKFYLLAAVAAAALFGGMLAFWVDPLPLLVRSLTLGVLAPFQWLLNQLAAVIPALRRTGFLAAPLHYRMNWVALAIFVAILALGAYGRRFWCRYLCPLGALLALIGRRALVRKCVNAESCVKCMKCLPACDMGAISSDPTQYSGYECIDCFGCEAICPEAAITLRPAIGAGGRSGEVDLSRRRLVQAAAFGAVGAVVMKTELGARPISQSVHEPKIKAWDPQLLRPPGAAAEDQLVAACIRCGDCMRVCPTNGIQPALGEAGLEGFWTPVLVPRIGPCAAECIACGEVCPTDALAPFTAEEKCWIYLGTAIIDRSTCLVWAEDRQCLVCDEYCTYDAIYWKEEQGRRVPDVDEFRCVGCGLCENACPVQPLAAIRVYSTGDKREWPRKDQRRWHERMKALSRALRKGEVPAPSTYPAESPPTETR